MHVFEESSQWHSPAHQLRMLPNVQCSHFGALWWPQFTLPWSCCPGSSEFKKKITCRTSLDIMYNTQFQIGISSGPTPFFTFKMFTFDLVTLPVCIIFAGLTFNRNCTTRFVLWMFTTVLSISECVAMCFWTYAFF